MLLFTMKLTILKGIGHDLASHLDYQMSYGYFKDIPKKRDINILEKKDELSKMCIAFFKEILPTSFNFNRIKEINLNTNRSSGTFKISIKIKVDNIEFKSYNLSFMH